MITRLLETHSLAYYLQGKELFYGVSLHLNKGERYGLIGPNGVGKTTLLKILAAQLNPGVGSVTKQPGTDIYLMEDKLSEGTLWENALQSLAGLKSLELSLRQEEELISKSEGSLEAYAQLLSQYETKGGYNAEQSLKKHLTEFGFSEARFSQNVNNLSGGERMRLVLAMALSQQADVLLLDEPSNHLDIAMKHYLQKKLAQYPGALMIASHDRALLDAVCTHILSFDKGQLKKYSGNYSAYKVQQNHEMRTRKNQLKEKAKLELSLETSYQAPAYQQAEKRRKKLEHKLAAFRVTETTESSQAALQFRERQAKGLVYAAKHLGKQLGEFKLEVDKLQLYAGDKLALLGANGSGKSTLLKLISGELESDNPKVESYWQSNAKLFYFDQQQKGLVEDQTLLEGLEYLVSSERAKMLLALVKLPPDHWHKLPHEVSSGQRARAGIAKLIASEANILLLDEPTNALDLPLIEILESSLRDSAATVLLASHDETLIKAVCKDVWSIESGKLVPYRGGLDGYYKGRKQVIEEPILVPEQTQEAESDEAKLERLELERLSLEDALLDPYLLTERERERAKVRYADLFNELSLIYDAPFPEPLPRFQVVKNGVLISSNGFLNHICLFETAYEVTVKVQKPSDKAIGHITFLSPKDSCLLTWARLALVKAVIEIAFERLELSALQVQTKDDLSNLGFQAAEANWWLLQRSYYEEQHGFIRPESKAKQRKKRRFRTQRNNRKANIKLNS